MSQQADKGGFRGPVENHGLASAKGVVEATRNGLYGILLEKFSKWPKPVRDEIDARISTKMSQGFPEKYRTRVIAWAQGAFMLDWVFGYMVKLAEDEVVDKQALLAHHRCYMVAVAKLDKDLDESLAADKELQAGGKEPPWEEVE